MDRREFLMALGAASGLSLVSLDDVAFAQGAPGGQAAPAGPPPLTESRKALGELLSVIEEIDARFLGAEWGITRPSDVADGHRFLAHILQGAFMSRIEEDPDHPVFLRITTPKRKFLGDNPDAVYFEAPIRPDRTYRVRGNTAGAAYTSFTIEAGAADGGYPTHVSGAINDTEFDVAPDGSYEILIGPDAPKRNGLTLTAEASRITTRHYFEEAHSVAADPSKVIPLSIECLDDVPVPPTPTDASIAAALRRVIRDLQGKTLEQPRPQERKVPSWVSTVPNVFPKPEKPAGLAYGAVDNAYSMTPYVLLPDQALVITGRYPKCRFANLVLWNRFLQTYDYAHRRVSINRTQTKLEADGSFRIVLAHADPGVPNWVDTEGRPSGILYWRFLLPESEIETPKVSVVAFADVARKA